MLTASISEAAGGQAGFSPPSQLLHCVKTCAHLGSHCPSDLAPDATRFPGLAVAVWVFLCQALSLCLLYKGLVPCGYFPRIFLSPFPGASWGVAFCFFKWLI